MSSERPGAGFVTRIVVLRPEPGNGATAARVAAAGGSAVRMPLFAASPVAWAVPDAGEYDALLLTSANAVRHGRAGLAALRGLPVVAVGAETARMAQAAGFSVVVTGTGDAAEAAAQASGRLLHLAGRDHRAVAGATTVVVYAAEALPIDVAGLGECVAMLHSARAAARLAALVGPTQRAGMTIAALSPAVAEAAGGGWRGVFASAVPRDAALVALAVRLAGAQDD